MNQTKSKVLVLDGNGFPALSILRSLGRADITVTVASHEDKSICSFSRFANNTFIYPNPLKNEKEFQQFILTHVKGCQYDLVIPASESTALPLVKIVDEINEFSLLAAADATSLDKVIDKSITFAIAEQQGVPIPKSITIEDSDTLKQNLANYSFPIVVKPSTSIAHSGGNRTKMEVTYAFDKKELLAIANEYLPLGSIILQEYFEGLGVGIEIIADHGKVIHAFQHQRMHEMPLSGGGSCLRKSTEISEVLLTHARNLIKELNWHGVAMIEFKFNPKTKQCCLMEINGRFWGSLPLATASGSNFPLYLYKLLVEQEYPAQFTSAPNHYARKLQADIHWFILVLFKRDNNPLIKWPSKSRIIKDFLLFFHPKHHIDSFAIDDMKPGLVDFSRSFTWFYRYTKEFVSRKIELRKQHKIRQNKRYLNQLQYANNILFMCYGNINRSAIAKVLYDKLAPNNHQLVVNSAGFHSPGDRPADPNMINVASADCTDISNWSSTTVNDNLVSSADVIFVMELEHKKRLLAEFPKSKGKILLLKAIDTNINSPIEIPDPYGKSITSYQECYDTIKDCIYELLKLREN